MVGLEEHWIPKIIWIHPVGTMNVCIECLYFMAIHPKVLVPFCLDQSGP